MNAAHEFRPKPWQWLNILNLDAPLVAVLRHLRLGNVAPVLLSILFAVIIISAVGTFVGAQLAGLAAEMYEKSRQDKPDDDGDEDPGAAFDDRAVNLATTLGNEKGYIIEVQGYSKSGVQTSQAMADSVVRYLVTEHQVPVYRIYKTGLGKNTEKPADGEQAVVNGVKVTLLHNSLATMSSDSASTAATTPKTSHSGVSSPQEVNQ